MHHFRDCFLSARPGVGSKDASVSWYPGTLTFPGDFSGVPEYHFSPRPRAAELQCTQVQLGMKGCLSKSRSSSFPSPPSGTGYLVFFVAGFLHPNQILFFCPGGTRGLHCRLTLLPGSMHVLASCRESCVWVMFCLCLEHTGKVASIVWAHSQWWWWLPLLLL